MRYRRRSLAQIDAARRNGARSRGPITPEGRRKSSLNLQAPPPDPSFLKAAKSILIPGESELDFARLTGFFLDRLKPTDHIEGILVQRMVVSQWQLLRVWGFERLALITAPEDDSEDAAARCFTNFIGLHSNSRVGSALQVSAQRSQRQFDQALAQLNRFRGYINLSPIPTSASKQRETSEILEPDSNPGPPNPDRSPAPSNPDSVADEPPSGS